AGDQVSRLGPDQERSASGRLRPRYVLAWRPRRSRLRRPPPGAVARGSVVVAGDGAGQALSGLAGRRRSKLAVGVAEVASTPCERGERDYPPTGWSAASGLPQRSAQPEIPATIASSSRPFSVRAYSMRTGTSGNTERVTMPADSNSRKRSERSRSESPGTRSRISPKRFDPVSNARTIAPVQRR